MSKTEERYLEALKRLISSGSKISVDAVAKEAGRKASSIRKDRMPELVKLINNTAENQHDKDSRKSSVSKGKSKDSDYKSRVDYYKSRIDDYKNKYHLALEKVASLEQQVFELEQENYDLRNKKVMSLVSKK